MSLVTVNNLYENGVCDEFTIYTGTTYNGDPYIIPVSAQSIGSHSLPHTFDVGTYEGPLYIFLVHCDFYVTPPPSETPKRQGGFQVKLINIDCENCPPFSPVATPSPTSTPTATPTTNCNFTVNFVEYYEINLTPTPSPTPTPSATTNCNSAVNFVEYYEVNLTPTPTPSPSPSPSATANCDFDVDINIATPTPTPSPSPTPPPESEDSVTNCVINWAVSMTPCQGGTFDDYMEGVIYLTNPVTVNTDFTIRVDYVPGGPLMDCSNPHSQIDLTVTVEAGQDTGLLTCPQSPFIDWNGATICSSELIDPPISLCTPT